ncbi:hypothetical protein I5907_14260 [Panacibacter sp. DH6]|uniref:Uncharacterized protein n=1 Tax=Panacibacter microcysteis TaxID=2793269 RepID=A0A931E5G3_9BACT|nr:hypothetical protein [Panacibacter microcysteis]MBG9377403.1 hypothetical protein [Panacibacter microcysteis]
MTGTLSQIITLTSFGNDFIFNNKLNENFDTNLSFKYCNKVDFRLFEKPFFFMKQKEKVIADIPNDWFKYLKKNGCKKLRLYFRSSADQSFAKDYKLAGLVGGGGTWFVEAVYEKYSNAWASRWEVTKKHDPNDNIWTVNYAQTLSNLPTMDLQISLQKSKEELQTTLTEIEAFAIGQKLDYWSDQFTKARHALISNTPESFYYNSDLVVNNNYSLTARQILYAAGTAWVFGAMGSWNDLGFNTKEDNEKYETLTETLYAKVNEAIISATNSY